MAAKTIEEMLKETKIYQILRPNLWHSLPSITVREAIEIMQRAKAGYLVIADEHMKILGMFTERDVLMKVLKKGVSLDDKVEKHMKKGVRSLSKSDTVGAAINLMNEDSVRHVPLVDEYGQLTGVLSIRTIVTFLAELFPTEIFNLPPKPQIHETVEGG